MSADAYSQCPKCLSKISPALLQALKLITDAGGDGKIPGNEETLRQDYEIYFETATHTLHIDFHGKCRECGWTFTHNQEIVAPL